LRKGGEDDDEGEHERIDKRGGEGRIVWLMTVGEGESWRVELLVKPV
jgi:hypothetical protein